MDSYSQYQEDLTVAKIFGDFKGRLLEIGAWQPKTFSNSRLLIEAGWQAVLVEFSPDAVKALVKEYGWAGSEVQILQAAVALEGNGSLELFTITDDSVSTSDDATLAKWKDQGGYYGSMWVPKLTLEHLFFQFGGGHDFISIDTEGSSVPLAIHAIRDLAQRPRVLCIEHDGRTNELMAAVQEHRYAIVHANGTNVILERR